MSAMSILVIACGFSQNEGRRENVEFGVKAGLNISNVWDAKGQDFNADPKTGFAVGIFLGIPFNEFIGLQPEVLISQKGFKGEGSLLGLPYSFSRTTTYLDVPLQLQLKPADFLTFVVGPQFSYLVNQQDRFSFAGGNLLQEQEFKNENNRKNVLGFVFGADLIFGHVLMSARAGWDFQNNIGDGTSTTPRYKNQLLQFTLGVKI